MSSEGSGSEPAELERRIAELEQGAERLRTVLEHAPVMIDAFDESGRCTLWNRECERRLGWSREEIEASDDPLALSYPDPEERNRVLEVIAKADGEFREYRVRAKDGSTRAQLWADFKLPGIGESVSVGYDITEQRGMEERLRQSQKLEAIGRLTGGLAHDFNNLLTVILGNTRLISAGLPSEARELGSLVDQIQSAAEGGARLIRKLLTFSRKTALSVRAVDLGAVVEEALGTLERLLPESIEIEHEIPHDLPPVRAEPDAVEQILMNLAVNARDAMPKGGCVRIVLRRELLGPDRVNGDDHLRAGDYVRLEVTDHGTGMSEATLRQAFDPFFSTKPVGEGGGLGLSIVYGLMEQQGGFVDILTRDRMGTTVSTYFPVHEAEEVETPSLEASPEPSGGSETVLVVEDEEPIRRIARTVLENSGYTVLEAGDGRQALDLLRRQDLSVDLVVTDVVMPKMGGSDLCRAAARLVPEVRFLLMSGYVEAEAVGQGEMPFEAPLLAKPWTPEELLTRIREVLD